MGAGRCAGPGSPRKEAIEARHRQASRAAQGNDNVHYHTRGRTRQRVNLRRARAVQ